MRHLSQDRLCDRVRVDDMGGPACHLSPRLQAFHPDTRRLVIHGRKLSGAVQFPTRFRRKRRAMTTYEPEMLLCDSEASALADLAADLNGMLQANTEEFCQHALGLAHDLPYSLACRLTHFAGGGSGSGYLLVKGVLTGPVPKTPLDSSFHVGAGTLLAQSQAILNCAIGEMVGYEAEGEGRLFQDMVPSRNAANSQTSLGSLVPLEVHTEQAFSELRPTYISLACLRGDAAAATYLLSAKDLLSSLDVAELRSLRRPLWLVGVDESFLDGSQIDNAKRGPVPIVTGPVADPKLLFDLDLMVGVTPEAGALLKRVSNVWSRRRQSIILGPGDVLIVDNQRAIHGRSAFAPRFDGSDRFIVRSFIKCEGYSYSVVPGTGRIVSAVAS